MLRNSPFIRGYNVNPSEFMIARDSAWTFRFFTGFGLSWVPLGKLPEIFKASELLRGILLTDG